MYVEKSVSHSSSLLSRLATSYTHCLTHLHVTLTVAVGVLREVVDESDGHLRLPEGHHRVGGERQASLCVKEGMNSHCNAMDVILLWRALTDRPTLTVLGGQSHQTFTDRTC